MKRLDVFVLSVSCTCVGMLVCMGIGKAYAAPAPVVAEYAEAEIELYEAMYEATPVALDDMLAWSDAERVGMVAATLGAVTQPKSMARWQAGYETWLRDAMGLSDTEVIERVYAAIAWRSIWMAEAVFAQMGKPG